ncbi:hypothetical protein [Streptomyces mexicanus]|jgi:hypothetical protein|uniref:hypothetical protein n=1 Tax=Streptomyces mexicanus TaxID=178566 RepID=UPI0031E4E612
MRYGNDVRPGTDALSRRPGQVARDRHWARDLRTSLRCSVALLVLLLAVDGAMGGLTWWRGALWGALAVLLFVVLCPVRVSAGEGWLAARSVLRRSRVRTDLLVSVRATDGVARRLVLQDAFGGRVEIDPDVLVDNPALWYRFAEDARTAATNGFLRYGTGELRDLAERVDGATALTVLRISGLES